MSRLLFSLASFALVAAIGCSSSNGGSGPSASGDGGGGGGGDGGGSSGTPATQWTLSGTIQLASGEKAQALHVVVSTDENANSASTYLGAAAAVTVSGTTGTFTLPVDGSKISSPAIAFVILFDDTNGNGVNDYLEKVTILSPMSGSPVFCDATSCGAGADFSYIGAGTHGTGTKGSFSIDVSGWYLEPGCRDDSCAALIRTDHTDLSGVTLTYATPLATM